ncbi:hypothetical protein NHF46_24265 [Arthrobacter alpinus]|uniref:SseB protein N-terminal domain-containing protein n=1 Tax=Arthrobacter alpinus TaxID=656366 RepID=A0A0S2LVY6_9MICC|nr:hypothetical protein [Arthrobacter alpinus]ALO65291.1 hypothetical protein AS189_00790 [Arthrobacter alpinus]MDD0859960.1 hypothetical protein [Arthrobacter alpinus]
MALWQDSFHDWAQAWATLQDVQSTAAGAVVTIGAQQVMVWPGDGAVAETVAAGSELVLVTDDPTGATEFAQSQGLRATTRNVLLSAETEDLELVPDLPPDAYLAEAPMENYDLVEVALFDRPVGSGRLKIGDGIAVMAALMVDEEHATLAPAFEQAMVAGLGEEAFTHGADTLYLIAGEEQADRFAAVEGWRKVADILRFTR